MGPGGVCLLIACILMKKQDIRAITALICSKVISNKNFLLYTLARKLRLRRTSDGDWSIWTLLKTKPTLFSRFVVQRCELRYRRGSCQVKKSCSKVGSCVFVFVMLSQTAKIDKTMKTLERQGALPVSTVSVEVQTELEPWSARCFFCNFFLQFSASFLANKDP